MTNYIDTLDSYETPLFDHQMYSTQELEERDLVHQIKIRMILTLALAIIVASTLSLFALPHQIGVGSGTSANSASIEMDPGSESGVRQSEMAAANNNNYAALLPSDRDMGIAEFFTPEIQHWENDIVRWANQHNVDPNAVATIMQIESCGNPQAVSVAGARGLFQVMPFHFNSGEDMLDPDTNARRGLDFLNEQLRYTDGDIFLSFAGYNGGYAASGGRYETWANETQRYYQWAKGIYEDANAGASESETLNTWLDAGGRPGCQLAADYLGI